MIATGISALFFFPLAMHLVQVARWFTGVAGAFHEKTEDDAPVHEGAAPSRATEVTVVLPVRNEARTLPRLLGDLASGRTLPQEVIIVDDASDDGTVDVISGNGPWPFSMRIIANPGRGKKAGLSAGIRAATTPWVVQVDADVRVGKRFLDSISRELKMQGQGKDMFLLPLRLSNHADGAPKTTFARLQALDFAAMQGWAVSAVRRGRPAMASGGAWIWRASAFPHDELRPDIASGDDVFSLAALLERGDDNRVGWCGLQDAMASAATMPDFAGLLDQRIRWGAKATAYPKALSEARRVAMTIAAVHLSGIILIPWAPAAALAFWTAKALIDMAYTHRVGQLYGLFDGIGPEARWGNLLLLAVVHPIFIITTLVLMPFRRVRWKGRSTA